MRQETELQRNLNSVEWLVVSAKKKNNAEASASQMAAGMESTRKYVKTLRPALTGVAQ